MYQTGAPKHLSIDPAEIARNFSADEKKIQTIFYSQ